MKAFKVTYLNENEADVIQLPVGRQIRLSSDENVKSLVDFFTGAIDLTTYVDRNLEDTLSIDIIKEIKNE